LFFQRPATYCHKITLGRYISVVSHFVVHPDDFADKSADISASHTAATSWFGTGATMITRKEQEEEKQDKSLILLLVVQLHCNSGNRTVKGMWKMKIHKLELSRKS